MPRQALPTSERLLTAAECARRRGIHVTAWWGIARDNLGLKRGRVPGKGRTPTMWLESAVTRYLRSLAGGESAPRAGFVAKRALAKQQVTS